MRGMTSNLEVEMVLMLGMMKMVVCKRSFSHKDDLRVYIKL
jgi:hypothetical protein